MDRRVLFATLVLALAVVLGAGTVFFAFVDSPDTTREPTVEWESASVGTVADDASLATVAVENGSRVAVPVAGEDCGVRVLDGEGAVAWSWTASDCDAGSDDAALPVAAGTLGDTPVVAVVDGDTVRVFDAVDGAERFTSDLAAPSTVAPTFADVTGSNESALVAVDAAGTVHVVDGEGESVWTADVGDGEPVAPAAADVTGDGAAEVVVATTGEDPTLLALGEDGDERWTAPLENPATTVTAPATSQEPIVVVADDAGSVLTFRGADGDDRWSVRLQDAPLTVGGVESTLVHLAGGGDVWAVDLIDGEVVWKQQFGGSGDTIRPLTAVATTETVVVTRDGGIAAITRSGEVVSRGSVDGTVVDNVVLAEDGGLPTTLLLTEDGRVIAVTT